MFQTTTTYALPLALLAISTSRSHAACDGGVISTFTGACTYANFVDNLSADCRIEDLFPAPANAAEEVADICAYDAPTAFVEIQGTYQRDRRYFAGGGPLVDGGRWELDAARLRRFEANLGAGTLIAFPEYAARVQYNAEQGLGTNGYPANMNLDAGCDLNTIMCCFTDDGQGDGFAAEGDATTDVCRHDLRDSPQSSHIKQGWSIFPGAETPTHCVGFTWQDGDEEEDIGLLGNRMYDVSLRNTANKGYLKGVPGAPMCGCVENMPVVEEAACRTAAKIGDGEIAYAFHLQPPESGIKAVHGICLHASEPDSNGGKVHMWECDTTSPNQQWEYNPATKQIKAVNGKCLDANERNTNGGTVHMFECDTTNENQQWDYNPVTQQIKAVHGICLDASERNTNGGKVHMFACDTTNENQQWDIQSEADVVVYASNTVGIQYGDCAAGDLKAQYVANQGGDAAKAALIDDHLVGAGGCEDDVVEYLNEEHFLIRHQHDTKYITPDPDRWSDLVVGEGIYFLPPAVARADADAHFRGLIEAGCSEADAAGASVGRHCIVRRICATCYESHRDIYYKRKTALPSAESSPRPTQGDDAYKHYPERCVSGENLVKYTGKTVLECKELCDAESRCLAFEYGVDYGGNGPYKPADCQLQTSRDMGDCDGRFHNLDLYVKLGDFYVGVYFLDLFMNNWVSEENDMAQGDFELYSSYEDALAGKDAWTHCDYGDNDTGFGFPRNCGPTSHVGDNWNSYTRNGGRAEHHGFYVEKP